MTGQIKLVPKRRFREFQNTRVWEDRYFFDNIKSTVDFRGRTPKKLGLNWSENGYLALSALNVKNGYIDSSADAHYGNQELYDKWMTGHELRKGQVLFTTEAPMGNTAQVPDDKGYILSQRTIAFDVNPEKITDDFLAVLLRSPKTFAELSALSSGGTAKGVSQKSLSQLKVTVPTNLEEQVKIGVFFKNLDQLITIQQRKLEKTKALKSAYLSEMFPAEGEREPKRRFAGFTNAWEERHFFDNIKNTIDFRGRTPKKLGLDWSGTGYLALSALNVKNGYIDFNADVHYGNQELYDKWMTGRELRKGQVLFTTEAPMGNVAQVPDDKGYILSQRTIAFDVNPEKITDDFLAVLLRSPKIFAGLSALSSGGTAKGVSQKSLSQLKVTIPTNLEEQIKIGAFFKNLEHLITLHQRKLEKLQNIKKAYLNEMFV
ncbi:restriction endonuclease subunit S [Bacillus sp. R-CC1]